MIENCQVCEKKILNHSKIKSCHVCEKIFHLNCISVNSFEVSSLILDPNWICVLCNSTLFPFNHFYEDEDFFDALSTKDHFELNWESFRDLIFNPLSDDHNDFSIPIDDADPDQNFYSDLVYHSATLCQYYTENKFLDTLVNGPCKIDGRFSLLHSNLRSMPQNFSSFSDYIHCLQHKWSLIGITETWLTKNNSDLYNLPGYSFLEKHREDKGGGGVGLFIPDNMNFVHRKDLSVFNDTIESLFIEVKLKDSKSIIVGVVYRPPGGKLSDFNDAVDDILSAIKAEKKTCYLMGDWNINLLSYDSHEDTSSFVDMMYSYGFLPLINRPTRVTKSSATIIDNIFSNESAASINSSQGILVTDISDHFPVFHISKCFNDPDEKIFVTKRSFTEKNKDKFVAELGRIDWEGLLEIQDAQMVFSRFHKLYCEAFNKHFPLRKVKINRSKNKPWITNELKEMINHKNKLFHAMIKCNTAYNETLYKFHRNKVKHEVEKAEREFYSNLLQASKGNLRKTWTILKNIINKNKSNRVQTEFKIGNDVVKNKTIIAENFNEFFTNIGPNLASKIPAQSRSPSSFLSSRVEESLFLKPLDYEELQEILDSLNRCAPGYDGISKDILFLSLPFICHSLLHMINLSLSQGVFPDEMKLANIIPLFKAEDPMLFNNYRPVSLLSIFSKLYEKVMYKRLMDFLEEQKILYNKQFGFRKGHSTYMPIMLLVDRLVRAMERGDFVIGLFLDFSKAFDTVDHKILIEKLEHYGIRGIALDWLVSYLDNRQQFVTYNEISSSRKTMLCGVPQGSILGPILFLLYINDLVNVCEHSMPFLFADDTNLFTSGSNLLELATVVNDELKSISLWLKVNKLSLNVKKTHFMVFTSKKQVPKIKICIDEHSIAEEKSTKFLGIHIDNKLNWKKHIKHVESKVSRGIGIVYRARHVLNTGTMKMLYYSFVYPYFSYCNHVWGSVKPKVLEKMVRLQKRVVRTISFAKYRAHTAPLFKKHNLLKLHDVNTFSMCKFMYNWYHDELPSPFDGSFKYVREIHSIETRAAEGNSLYPPKFNTDPGKNSYTYQGVIIWNKVLSANINPDVSDCVFAKSIKHCIQVGLL